jgi:hypothetical protein
VQAGDRRFNVKAGGAFRTLEAVKDTPVRSIGGQVVRVRDVADVAWAQDEPTHLTRFNGKRAMVRHRDPEGRPGRRQDHRQASTRCWTTTRRPCPPG